MLQRLDAYFAAPLRAVSARTARGEILATNIANADTPNYKARDLDFAAALQGAQQRGLDLTQTSERHLAGKVGAPLSAALRYRVPMQDSIDGNTVESDTEVALFSNNAIGTQADLAFLNSKIRGLFAAIQSQ